MSEREDRTAQQDVDTQAEDRGDNWAAAAAAQFYPPFPANPEP